MPESLTIGSFLAALLPFIGLIWGIRLYRDPSLYDPNSMLYRKMYFWYATWFNREVDDDCLLEEYEIRKAARFVIAISCIGLIVGIVAIYL